jgi:D-arginine dehydrogenase
VDTADVVIIGAGFAGAATAYHLAARGVRNILIIEREARAGVHASGRNASWAFQLLSDPTEARLAVEGTRFIDDPPEGFCTAPLLRRIGTLLVADRGGLAQLNAAQRDARALGLACELITPDDAVHRVPALAGAPLAAALWNPHDGVVDIRGLLHGYLAAAQRRGARIEYVRALTGVQVSHGRVEAVHTDRGGIETRCVVNAAGAWAGDASRLAGLETPPLEPRRRHMFEVVVDRAIERHWPFVWHTDIDVYFRPQGDGLLMSPCDVAPSAPCDPAVDPGVERLLAEKIARAFPALAPARVTSAWACLRTFAPDERFIIGRDARLDGFVWVAALGGHGMTTSPAVGRLGAAAVLGDDSMELRHFSPVRVL